jgi:CheY-like chemotaxis protein
MTQGAQNAKILLVDDDSGDAMLTRFALNEVMAGCNIEHVMNGHIGLQNIKQAAKDEIPYDIVIFDVNMNGIRGCELLKLTHADITIKHTFMAILTTGDCELACMKNDEFHCKNTPANIYLQKKIGLYEFEVEMRRLVHAYYEHRQKTTIIQNHFGNSCDNKTLY